MKQTQIKKLSVLAMLCALAYVAVALIRIPAVLFLKYEPKDVIIAFGGFLYGPLAALAVSVVVSLIEMITISDTGIIGCVMNIIGSVAFACTAAMVYRRNHTLKGACIGLILGALMMTGLMLLWNYALTPLYMDTPRADVAAMLLPVFLPFNLLKAGLNTALTILLYRPLVQGLRRAKLFPKSSVSQSSRASVVPYLLGALALLIGCITALLYLRS